MHRLHGQNLYEFRDDTYLKRAQNDIITSYHIRKKFPGTRQFSNYKFCRALCKFIEYKGFFEAMSIPEVRGFLKNEISPLFQAKLTAYIAKGAINRVRSTLHT